MKEITNLNTKARRLIVAERAARNGTTLKEAKNSWKRKSEYWKNHDVKYMKIRILAEERRAKR